MTGRARHALVLFDVDGYTSIVQTSKLVALEVEPVKEGQQCVFHHCKTDYKVEVLKLSDSKPELNSFEKAWSRTERAVALDNEKRVCCGKENGFLLVGVQNHHVGSSQRASKPAPKNTERLTTSREAGKRQQCQPTTATGKAHVNTLRTSRPLQKSQGRTTKTKQTVESGQPQPDTATEILGSNNRKISVLHQGSGQQSLEVALPNRQPVFLNDLREDERDCVEGRIREFECGKRTCATQTDDVIIFKNKDELLSAFDPKGKTLGDIFALVEKQNTQIKEMYHLLKSSQENKILEEILTTVKAVKEDKDVSRLVQFGLEFDNSACEEVISDHSNEQLVETVDVEESGEPVQEDSEESVIQNCVLEDCSARQNEAVTENETHYIAYKLPVANKENDHPEVHHPAKVTLWTSPPPINSISNQLTCSSGAIVEVGCPGDMVYADDAAEVRVAPYLLRQLQSCSGWTGSFAWQIAQRIFSAEEILGHNYYGKLGKPGISPRRRHAIEHAIMDSIGDDVKYIRQAVEGINTGIRNKSHKLKLKENRKNTVARLQF